MAVEVVLYAVDIVALHQLPHELPHVRAHLPLREIDGAPVAERRALPLLGTAHQAVRVVTLEVRKQRIRLLESPRRVVSVVHAERHKHLKAVGAAECGGQLQRVCPQLEEVRRDVSPPAMRPHAVAFSGLAAGQPAKAGTQRTVRHRRDMRAERVPQSSSREVLRRDRQIVRPVVHIVSVSIVNEGPRTRERRLPLRLEFICRVGHWPRIHEASGGTHQCHDKRHMPESTHHSTP